jgi:hypothetical protein
MIDGLGGRRKIALITIYWTVLGPEPAAIEVKG